MADLAGTPRPKRQLTFAQRLARGLIAIIDPRAWLHLSRVVNYYNYTHVQEKRKLRRGAGAKFSPTVSFANAERIELGKRVAIGAHCSIWAGQHHGRIVIEDDALLGPHVMVTVGNYSFAGPGPVGETPMLEQDVRLGRNCFIGAYAIILPGVTVGENAAVGAGAVVTKDVAPGVVVAGNPAKQIGVRDGRTLPGDSTPVR